MIDKEDDRENGQEQRDRADELGVEVEKEKGWLAVPDKSSRTTADMGCRREEEEKKYKEMALYVGARQTGKKFPAGTGVDFSDAKIPDALWRIWGTNAISQKKFDSYMAFWKTPFGEFGIRFGPSNPRERFDGASKWLWR